MNKVKINKCQIKSREEDTTNQKVIVCVPYNPEAADDYIIHGVSCAYERIPSRGQMKRDPVKNIIGHCRQ